MKSDKLDKVIESIGAEYESFIEKGARHYIEVSIGRQAEKLGFSELTERYGKVYAIVPLHAPRRGMKVRIDGRTFVNYAEFPSGIAVPGYLARETGRPYKTFIPNDSMICNFSS